MVTVTYFFTIQELSSKRNTVESQMRRVAENIATMQLLDRQDWSVYQNYISRLIDFNKDIVYIAIYDDRYTLRAHSLNHDLVESQFSNPSRLMEASIVRWLDGGAVAKESQADLRSQRVNIQIGDRILGSVHVGFSLIEINDQVRSAIFLNIGLALFFLLVFSAASFFISARLTKPLEQLSSAMFQVADGNLDLKIHIETQDEISQLADNFNEMVEGLKERKIIEELGWELGGTFIINELALQIREQISRAIGVSAARLYIRKKEPPNIYEEITVPDEQRSFYPAVEINLEAQHYLMKNAAGFMIHDSPKYLLNALKHDFSSPNGLVVPMLVQDELLGMLFFELPENLNTFTTKQQHFAVLLATQATLALDNVMLYEDRREQERLKRELEIAREVQQKLLPRKMPEIGGFQIEGFCQSAQEVGGDYFDFFTLDSDHLGMVIADVSGKGTSASFYMAEIKGMMIQLAPRIKSPKNLLYEINRSLYDIGDRHLFVTMVYGILEISSSEFIFSRAGHNPMLYLPADGDHRFITPKGIGLGLDAGNLFLREIKEATLKLSKNDLLIFYTDGITEAMNTKLEPFGEERMIALFNSDRPDSIGEYRHRVLNSLSEYMNGQEIHDDLTMIILRCDK
jgi:serine phosphatase RsbU (regulator of sigma subunit)/HAMP domain-containing protein